MQYLMTEKQVVYIYIYWGFFFSSYKSEPQQDKQAKTDEFLGRYTFGNRKIVESKKKLKEENHAWPSAKPNTTALTRRTITSPPPSFFFNFFFIAFLQRSLRLDAGAAVSIFIPLSFIFFILSFSLVRMIFYASRYYGAIARRNNKCNVIRLLRA